MNPVRARITADPLSYPWSSAGSHAQGEDDDLVRVKPLLELVPDWQAFLRKGIEEKENQRLRIHERTGRPLGDEGFIKKIENVANRVFHKQKPGPKKEKKKN